jgi:hypothetical protein
MTPGLVLSNRRTNGFNDNNGIRTTFPGSSVNAQQNQEDGPVTAASHPHPMLQTFLITSIKRELKTLIINISGWEIG